MIDHGGFLVSSHVSRHVSSHVSRHGDEHPSALDQRAQKGLQGQKGANGQKGQKGMTLIELLVAVMCMSIIMLGFISIFQTLTRMWTVGNGDIDINQNLGLLVQRMGPQIRSAVPLYPVAKIITGGTDVFAPINFIGSDSVGLTPLSTFATTTNISDQIQFHTYSRTSYEATSGSTSGTEILTVYYWIKLRTAGKTDYECSYENDNSRFSTADTVSVITTTTGSSNGPLAYSIRGMSVQYLDSAGTWLDAWNARTKGYLPELVRVTLTGQSGTVHRNRVFIFRPGCQGLPVDMKINT